MDKTLCRNNLVTIGKWGGASFLFGVTITAFVFGGNLPLHAYVLDMIPTISTSQETSPSTQLTLDFNSIGKINNVTAPVNSFINGAINILKLNMSTSIPLSPIKNPSQNIDFSKFFSSSTVSSGDIMSFLKEAAVTGINLSILVISITTQVLKGLLSIFKQ